MNIAKEITEEQVGVVTVTLSASDYADEFENQLRNYRKQIQMPGFRPGTVPPGLVRKRFGPGILFDQLSKAAMEHLSNYLQNEQVKVLGRPYLMRSNMDGEGEELVGPDYFFEFQMGIQPEVQVNLEGFPELVQYTVEVSDEDVEDYIKDLRYKSGIGVPAEAVEDTANRYYILKCRFEEVDDSNKPLAEGEGFSSDLYIHTRFSPKVLTRLNGKKAGDALQVRLDDIFDSERAAMQVLEVAHDYYHELEHKNFLLTIQSIEEQKPAEENNDWFNKMLRLEESENKVTDRAGFVAKVKEYLQQEYTTYAGRQYEADFIRALLNAHPFPLPVAFIRQFLHEQAKEERERQDIDRNFTNYLVEFRLRFIYDALIEQHPELKVTEADIKAVVKDKYKAFLGNMQQEGEDSAEADKRLDQLVDALTASEEMMEREGRQAQDVRIKEWLLDNKFRRSSKTVTAKGFDEATKEPDHHH